MTRYIIIYKALNGLKIEKEQADTSDPLTDNGTRSPSKDKGD